MKRLCWFASIAIGVAVFWGSATASAETVRIQPLQFQTSLKKAEKKKSFVDITNPSGEKVEMRFYVQGFRQVDNKGNLTFFDSEHLAAGIILDYKAAMLDAHQTLRLYFTVDGSKLPTGDVFAAIFAESVPSQKSGTVTAVRVGSLVMVTNQTPGSRQVEIAGMDIPFLQTGDGLSGELAVKNPAPEKSATGFFPEMKIEIAPWGGERKFKGPLVFAGKTRTFGFSIPSSQFGIYAVTVRANDVSKTAYVFMMTGWWKIAAPILLLCVAVLGTWIWRWRRLKTHTYRKSRRSA